MVDIDGTLIGEDSTISPENREALARARQRGIYISLSTGRSLNACRSIIEELSLDGCHISFDGALVSSPHPDEEVYARPISQSGVRQMVEDARYRGLNLELYSAKDYFAEQETWSSRAHRQFFGIDPTLTDFSGIWQREIILKGGVVPTTPEEESKTDAFCLQFSSSLHFSQARTPAFPGIVFINILAPEVSKGKALEALARHLGVPVSQVMAVGDGSNDVPLLSAAGLAVAMGNARSEVKAVADYVTLDVHQHGLAAAIKKFLL